MKTVTSSLFQRAAQNQYVRHAQKPGRFLKNSQTRELYYSEFYILSFQTLAHTHTHTHTFTVPPPTRLLAVVGVGIFTVCKTERFGGKQTKELQFSPAGENPPQCSQDPCGDPSHSLRLNSDPPLAKSQNDPRPPLRRGPSHLPGNKSWPPT